MRKEDQAYKLTIREYNKKWYMNTGHMPGCVINIVIQLRNIRIDKMKPIQA